MGIFHSYVSLPEGSTKHEKASADLCRSTGSALGGIAIVGKYAPESHQSMDQTIL